jgi:ATP-dependent RNA helicase DHX57
VNQRKPGGFTCTVTLRRKNPKTNEVESVVLRPPLSSESPVRIEKETAGEAKHYAAVRPRLVLCNISPLLNGFCISVLLRSTLCLEQVPSAFSAETFIATELLLQFSNMLRLHMALPPPARDYWAALEIEKKKTSEKNAWMWAADPFTAASSAAQAVPSNGVNSPASLSRASTPGPAGPSKPLPSVRAWREAPTVRMSPVLRDLVESTIRTMAARFPSALQDFDSGNSDAQAFDNDPFMKHFVALGFRRGYVESALANIPLSARSNESLLQQLLVYTPEDDLPEMYKSRRPADADVRFETTLDVAERWMVDRICKEAGYPRDVVEDIVRSKQVGTNQGKALDLLGQRLIGETAENDQGEIETGIEERRSDETIALQALYDDRFIRHSETDFAIRISIDDRHVKDDVSLRVFFHDGSNYPSASTTPTLPTLFVSSETLPAYIRLHLTYLVLRHARDELADILETGQGGVVAELVEYLSTVLPSVVDHPPDARAVISRLYDTSAPISNAPAEASSSSSQRALLTRQPHRSSTRKTPSASNEELRRTFNKLQETSGYQAMLQARKNLPAWKLRNQLVDLIQSNRVVM